MAAPAPPAPGGGTSPPAGPPRLRQVGARRRERPRPPSPTLGLGAPRGAAPAWAAGAEGPRVAGGGLPEGSNGLSGFRGAGAAGGAVGYGLSVLLPPPPPFNQLLSDRCAPTRE